MRFKLIFALFMGIVIFGCEDPVKNNLNIQDVILTNPIDGAVSNLQTINFNWQDLVGVDYYQFDIATPDFSDEENIIVSEQLQTSNYQINFVQGNYMWRVKAINSQTETPFSTATFGVDTTLNLEALWVNITYPPNNTTVNSDSILIQWDTVNMATQYNLVIEEAVQNTIMTDETLTTTSYLEVFGEGTYRVKVRALNFATSTDFTTHSFVVDFTPPTPPTLTFPANGAIVTSPVPMAWNSHLSSVEDSIFIYISPAAVAPVIDKTSQTQGYNFIAASGTYYWRVVSYDSSGNASPASALQSFTVQ